ncbi:c-type cytochrome [Haliea sp. E17]|uniref:c-type cytochrome n=1 Tax=Haliea sp. E17 TaxID=3401576 RepID=UPI003AB0111B
MRMSPRSIVRKATLPALAFGLMLPVLAVAHLDDKEPMQSYRQSWFALLGMNFGPIGAMLKGEMPWDQAKLQMFANDMAALTSMDVARAFPPGSEQGKTRAKPEIWDNMDDFKAKLTDLQTAVNQLQAAAAGGDKQEIAQAVGATGKACKSCHDDYKSKDYLY